jgi:hypothetical protein
VMMEISINDIENILIKEDVEGFIEDGAPEDEYSTEARYIARALLEITKTEFTQENIVSVISTLWAKSFNLSREDIKNRLPALQRVTKDILNIGLEK